MGNTRLLTADQLAEKLQVHPKTLFLLARQGRIPRVTIGRAVRFDIDAVLAALAEREQERLEAGRE